MAQNKWKAALLGLVVALASVAAAVPADARTHHRIIIIHHHHHHHHHHRVVNSGGYG